METLGTYALATGLVIATVAFVLDDNRALRVVGAAFLAMSGVFSAIGLPKAVAQGNMAWIVSELFWVLVGAAAVLVAVDATTRESVNRRLWAIHGRIFARKS